MTTQLNHASPTHPEQQIQANANAQPEVQFAMSFLIRSADLQKALASQDIDVNQYEEQMHLLAAELADNLLVWRETVNETPRNKMFCLVDIQGVFRRARFFNGEWQSGIGKSLGWNPNHWCHVKSPFILKEPKVVLSNSYKDFP